MSSWGGLNIFKLKPDMDTLLANLFTGGVTKFLDGNKPIMYGQPGNDLLISPAYLQYYPTLISYKDNGAVILGGTGSDNIFGSQYNDKLLGGKGEDWLRGNDGNDSLIGGAGTGWDIFFIRSFCLNCGLFNLSAIFSLTKLNN